MDTNDIVNSDTVVSLETLLAEAASAKEAMLAATLAYEDKLGQIAKIHGNTYQHAGQWYQIRARESLVEGRKITYLCQLKAEPKTWLKGPKRKTANPPDLVIDVADEGPITSTIID